MCGLNATNPLHERTPLPLPLVVSPQLSTREGTKAIANGSQDGVKAWACDIVLIGKRLEGCDKMRQAHQGRLASSDVFSTVHLTYHNLTFSIQISSKAVKSKVVEAGNGQTGVQRPRAHSAVLE
jgi:hypothetical protein